MKETTPKRVRLTGLNLLSVAIVIYGVVGFVAWTALSIEIGLMDRWWGWLMALGAAAIIGLAATALWVDRET